VSGNDRTQVVVRVRRIFEDIALGELTAAQTHQAKASADAMAASARTRRHPIDTARGPISSSMLATASGTASALREAARSAAAAAGHADVAVKTASAEVVTAHAARKAAERLVERRVAGSVMAAGRAHQRSTDELVASRHRSRS
jgi:hypothetical protein